MPDTEALEQLMRSGSRGSAAAIALDAVPAGLGRAVKAESLLVAWESGRSHGMVPMPMKCLPGRAFIILQHVTERRRIVKRITS